MVDSTDNLNFEPPESNRFRSAIVILVLGIILVIWAWGSWIYRSSGDSPSSSAIIDTEYDRADSGILSQGMDYPDQAEVAKTLPTFLMFGFILVIVFLAASFILVRATRRYLAASAHKRAPPTDTTDIWSTHKLHDDDYGH